METMSIAMDVNDVARKNHIPFSTMENGHLMAAFQQMVSEVPPDESGSA